MKLTLLSRSYCSLCTRMLDALAPLQSEYGFTVDVVDVDDFPELVAQYDELVPVLLAADDKQICHWHLDEAAVRAYCRTI
ncbi:MAG: glutaredoxin family protein [Neisseria sp.]|nr:glutaredoxin family protein [Neisseria sp.]